MARRTTSLELYHTSAQRQARLYQILCVAAAGEARQIDAAIDARRAQLRHFERAYDAQLAPAQRRLERTLRLLHHLQRWQCALAQHLRFAPAAELRAFGRQQATQRRHDRRTPAARPEAADDPGRTLAGPTVPPGPADRIAAPSVPPGRELQRLRRELARRLHPDYASDPAQAAQRHALMAQVNAWVQQGDAARLALLAGATLEAPPRRLAADGLGSYRARWRRLAGLRDQLRDEWQALARSDLSRLMHYAAQHPAVTQRVRRRLRRRQRAAQADVAATLGELEGAVQRYNHERALQRVVTREVGDAALGAPSGGSALLALGLRQARQVPEDTQHKVQRWLSRLANERPLLCRAVLLTYLGEQSRLPLPDLTQVIDLERRLQLDPHIPPDAAPRGLADALVQLHRTLEYAVRQINPRLLRGSLRFLRRGMADAVGACCHDGAIGQQFVQLLRHLGPILPCASCATTVATLPAMARTAIDPLRALLCPRCGRSLRRYRLLRGDDVASLFNALYLRHGLLAEQCIVVEQTTCRLQFLAPPARRPSGAEVLRQLHRDLFVAHAIPVARAHLRLGGPGTRRAGAPWHLEMDPAAPLDLGQAMAQVRCAVATRWEQPTAQTA